jgi:hypothetical protein
MTRWVWLVLAAMAAFAIIYGPRGVLLVWAVVAVVFAVRVLMGRDRWSLRPDSPPAALANGLASVLLVIVGGLIAVLALAPFSVPLYAVLGAVGVVAVGSAAYLGRRIRRPTS